jgi:tetratricopeptide (TPR) repeat protein
MDMPTYLQSLSIPFSPLLDVDTLIPNLLASKHYTAARRNLQQALSSEVKDAGNFVGNRIKIFQLLAKVYNEEEKRQEAIENANRANELEANIGPLSNLQLVQHHGILARLYEKAGDIDSMRLYIRSLLTNANSSYKDDPETKIECHFHLRGLQTAKRLDSSISDIYLLLRATLVACQYENSSSSNSSSNSSSTILLPATWMPRSVKLTNGTPLNWLFGAPGLRPQMLANLIPLHYLQQDPEYPILIFDGAPRSTESKPGRLEQSWSR